MANEENEGMKWFIPEEVVGIIEVTGNGSANRSILEEPYQQIISDEAMWYLNLYIVILLCGTLATFGAMVNVINMIIFFRLGLKDSMTVCLFALAFTDFTCSFLVVITRIFSVWGTFFPTDIVDPMAVWYVGFGWVVDSLYLCSGWITTFLSIERCTCVVFPFKVKEIFTRNRSFVAIFIIYVVIESTYFPLYVTHWLEWITVDVVTANRTIHKRRLIVMFTHNRAEIESYMSLLSGNILPVPSLIIIVGSVVWMILGLKASSKLRSSMATTTKEDKTGKQDSKLNNKTRRLVTVVILLAIVFTLCSVPRLFAKYMYIFNPETHEGGREVNMYSFKWQLTRVAFAINASVNIFIYLKINSSYRAKFIELFSLKRESVTEK